MVITVNEDVFDNTSTSLTLADGWSLVRKFIVDGVEGNPHSIVSNAILAFGIPKPGTPHPSIPLVHVESISGRAIGSRQVEILANYKSLSFGETPQDEEDDIFNKKRISGTVQSVDTNFFLDKGKKKLMTVTYDWKDAGKSPNGKVLDIQTGTVKKEVPSVVMAFSRIENESPFNKTLEFLAAINSVAWASGKKHQWLCTRIDSLTEDNGASWTVDYEFQFNPDGWDPDVSYVDPRTNKPPPDVEDKKEQPSALKRFQITGEKDFRKLKLGG